MTEKENLLAAPASAPVAARQPANQPMYADDEEASGSGGLRRYMSALIRYKWIVTGIFVLGTAVAVFAGRYATPKYTATVALWFEVAGKGDELRGPIQSSQLLQDEQWTQLA